MKYNEENRGKIQNPSRKRQIISFDGLRYGNITPTDLDGLIEYHGRAYVFMEYKLRDAVLPYGQQLALQRLTDDVANSGKEAVFLVCEHCIDDCNCDIESASAKVREYYWRGVWYSGKNKTAKQITDSFIQRFGYDSN